MDAVRWWARLEDISQMGEATVEAVKRLIKSGGRHPSVRGQSVRQACLQRGLVHRGRPCGREERPQLLARHGLPN
eukprot:4538052-Prymnesium_polylepis.2